LHKGGYQVIQSVEISRFRGFESLKVSKLKKFNLLTGPNASGKTAFLEALYLALGAHPEIYFKLKMWRGMGEKLSLPPTSEIWEDMFFNFDTEEEIRIIYEGTSGHTRSMKVFVDKNAPTLIPVDQQLPGPPQPPLTFQWRKGSKVSTLRPVFAKDGIRVIGNPEPVNASFFAANASIPPFEAAGRLGKLIKKGKDAAVQKAMSDLFPIIDELLVLPYAGEPMVHARTRGGRTSMPLGLVSMGINRVLSYFVSIFENSHNAVLIDEIESGIHHNAMPGLWEALIGFCRENDTQLFASSHSLEALKSLLPMMESKERDFCLLQTGNQNGRSAMRYVQGADFEAALEEGVEVR
jgi:predicted ATPase